MNLSIKYIRLLPLFALASACGNDEDFPLPNRCGSPNVIVHKTSEFDALFGNATGQLSTGDIAGSFTSADGRIFWFVNNTTLNTNNSPSHLHNCIIVQTGNTIHVKYGGSADAPQSLFEHSDPDSWYTINNGFLYDGKLELIISGWVKTGTGAFDYKQSEVNVVLLNEQTLEVETIKSISQNSELLFGSAILRDVTYTYIYGARNKDFTKEVFIARIPPGSLLQEWNYFDGYNWKTDLTEVKPLMNNVSDYYSVFFEDGHYFMVSQTSLFGQEVNMYISDHPEREWKFDKILYCKSEKDDHLLSSNTLVHRLTPNELVCGYSLLKDDLQTTESFKPVFVEIKNWNAN